MSEQNQQPNSFNIFFEKIQQEEIEYQKNNEELQMKILQADLQIETFTCNICNNFVGTNIKLKQHFKNVHQQEFIDLNKDKKYEKCQYCKKLILENSFRKHALICQRRRNVNQESSFLSKLMKLENKRKKGKIDQTRSLNESSFLSTHNQQPKALNINDISSISTICNNTAIQKNNNHKQKKHILLSLQEKPIKAKKSKQQQLSKIQNKPQIYVNQDIVKSKNTDNIILSQQPDIIINNPFQEKEMTQQTETEQLENDLIKQSLNFQQESQIEEYQNHLEQQQKEEQELAQMFSLALNVQKSISQKEQCNIQNVSQIVTQG